jgi:hypothetical protein
LFLDSLLSGKVAFGVPTVPLVPFCLRGSQDDFHMTLRYARLTGVEVRRKFARAAPLDDLR